VQETDLVQFNGGDVTNDVIETVFARQQDWLRCRGRVVSRGCCRHGRSAAVRQPVLPGRRVLVGPTTVDGRGRA